MPYFRCSGCGLRVYSAASWSTVDTCPSCCAPLRSAVRAAGENNGGVHRRFAASVDAPAAARAALAAFRRELGGDRHEVLLLLVSELVNNSVVHGPPGTVLIQAVDSGDCLRVEVTDDGAGFATRPRPPRLEDESGRGLLIVDRLASRWGVNGHDSTQVWFELDHPRTPALSSP